MYTRVRTQSTNTPPQICSAVTGCNGTLEHGFTTPAQGNQTLSMGSITKTTSDNVNVGYRKRVASGEIISSPFKIVEVTDIYPMAGTLDHRYYATNAWPCGAPTYPTHTTHNWWNRFAGNFRPTNPGFYGIGDLVRAELRQDAIDLASTQAFANINSPEMMALATVAESRKSVESIAAILLRAIKIIRNVKRLNGKALAKELSPKELADRYMEARYALRPLYYDVKGITKALAKERGHARMTARGYATKDGSATGTLSNTVLRTFIEGDWKWTAKYSVSARAGILCDVNVTESSVFGLSAIAETVWELLPFSFIIDWFVNVGTFIAAHTPNAEVRQLTSWVTVKEILTSTTELSDYRSVVGAGYGQVGGVCTLTPPKYFRQEMVLERIIGISAGTLPTFNLKLDGYKLTDLGIILGKILK